MKQNTNYKILVMKKSVAFLLLSITLFSCKKETTTVTKLDPETGKTVTIEVPADSVKEVVAVPAIKDSLGIFRQSFLLEKGATYPLTTVQTDKQTLTAPNGESQSGTSESRDEMSFTVNDIKGDIYDITINLLGKKTSQTMNGKSAVVDSKGAEPKEEELKMIYKVNKALIGNKLQMSMKKNGDVVSIKGFDAIYTKVNAAVAGILKDAKMKKAFEASFKDSFNEKKMAEQFSKNLKLIPTKGVKIGDKWTETENATPDGSVKLTTTYQLKSVGNGTAEIGVSGGIPKKSDKQKQDNFTRSMSSELTQNGTIVIDQNTGWVKTQSVNVKTTQTETITDGTQTQTMKSVSSSTVAVNP